MTPAHAALIAEVRAALAKATPGPWLYMHGYGYWSKVANGPPALGGYDGPRTPDITLTVQAPAWLAALCDALEGKG